MDTDTKTTPAGAGSQQQLVRGRAIRAADGSVSCAACGADVEWEECSACGGEGGSDGYEEDPVWYRPGEIVTCPMCSGHGGEYWCPDPACETGVIVEVIESPNAPRERPAGTEDGR